MPETMPSGMNSLGNYLNQGAGFINNNRDALMKAAKLLSIYGNYSDQSGRGDQILKFLTDESTGRSVGKGVASAEPTKSQLIKETVTKQYAPADTNKDGVVSPTEAKAAAQNPALSTQAAPVATTPQPGTIAIDPRVREVGNLLSTGGVSPVQPPGRNPVNPMVGGSSNVGLDSPVVAPTNVPSVQNLNEADYGNLGWMSGGVGLPLDVAKIIAANRLLGRERATQEAMVPIHRTSADAAMINAEANRTEADIKTRMQTHTINKMNTDIVQSLAAAGHSVAQTNDLNAKLSSTGPYSPAAIGAVESAKEKAKADATIAAHLAGVEEAAKKADLIPTTGALRLQGFKTHGDVIRATGMVSAGPVDASINAASQAAAAIITAGGQVKSALAIVVNAAQAALAPYDKMNKELPPGHPMKGMQELSVASGHVKLLTPENVAKRLQIERQRDEALSTLSGIGSEDKAPVDSRRRPVKEPTLPPVQETLVKDGKTYEKRGGRWGIQTSTAKPTAAKVTSTTPVKEPELVRPDKMSPRIWLKLNRMERIQAIEDSISNKKSTYYKGGR